MTALKAEKIFVDPQEEIPFLIQRLLKQSNEHIILVVPSSSVLFSSNLSVKVLARTLIQHDKVAILVTEDAYGGRIAQKAGLVVVQKVSQITSDLWEIAKSKQFGAKQELQVKKDELLKDIKGDAPVEKTESKKSKVEDVIKVEIDESAEITKDDEIIEKVEISGNISDDNDSLLKPKELKEKVKEIGGIQIYGGSDILKFKRKLEDDNINKLDNLDMNSNDAQSDDNAFNSQRFAGRDVTKLTPRRSKLENFFRSLFKNNGAGIRPEDRVLEPGVQKKWYQKRGFLIGAGIVGFLIFVFLLTVFQLSTVSVTVTLASEEVVAEETVEIDLETDEIDADQLVIPGTELETDEISVSSTAEANGEGRRGDKATGAVYIFNKNEEDVTVPAGSKITSVRSGLVYEIVEQVVLPGATVASDLSINPSRTDNIRVRAISFGDEYNVETSAADSGFTLEGFDGFGPQDVKREGAFTGGTGEDFVAVSEENVEQIKKEMLEDLEKDAIRELESRVPNGFRLIEDSIEFEEEETVSNPDIGEEATEDGEDNYVFDITVVGKATGVMVRERDLQEIIQEVIAGDRNSNQDSDTSNSVSEITDLGIKDFVQNSTGLYITIFAEGELTSEFDEDLLKDDIKGKSITGAESVLEDYEEITSFSVRYYPSVIPSAFQFVPRSASRINLIVR
jgi:hypothetical protein